jgi:predicted transcriptional regulator
VGSNPGLRIEQINRALGTRTAELRLPLRKLIAAKQIKTKGQRRATRYFAA